MLRETNFVRIGSFAFLLIYFIASFIPDSWLWGMHQLAFISLSARLMLVAVSSIIIMLPYFPPVIKSIEELSIKITVPQSVYIGITIAIAILSIFLFDRFRIATDIYGDSRTLLNAMKEHYYTLSDIFFAKESEPLTRLIHQTIASVIGLTTQSAISWGNIVSGGVYIVVLLLFIRSLDSPFLLKATLFILACSLGGVQLFFGYVEDYSYSFVVILLFLILGWQTLHGRNRLWLMLGLLVIGMRLHLVMLFMVPGLIYLFALNRTTKKRNVNTVLSFKIIIMGVIGSLVLGLLMYLFYFQAYSFITMEETERSAKIFLPLVNPLPEPHSYTLFSIGHFSDVIQILFYDLSPGIILILFLSVIFRKKITWRDPKIIFFGLVSLYSILFCITANPLLSFVRDWDLFAFVGLPLLFFAFSIIQSIPDERRESSFLAQICCSSAGLALLSSVFMYINTDSVLVNERVRQAGRSTFKNYYRGSSYMINVAEGSISDIKTQLEKRGETIESLLPYTGKQDYEMANLTSMAGKCALSIKEFSSAEKYFNLSLQYDSLNATALRSIALCKLMQFNINGASDVIDYYNLQINEPDVNDSKALLLAGFTNYIRYLNSLGADSTMIHERLESFYEAYTDTVK